MLRKLKGWKTFIVNVCLYRIISYLLLAAVGFGSLTKPQGCLCSQSEQQQTLKNDYNGKLTAKDYGRVSLLLLVDLTEPDNCDK